jgi:hypothetical protein
VSSFLETLAAVDVVCFDKTGTLTHGSMSLEAVAVGDRMCARDGDTLLDQYGELVHPRDDHRFRMLLTVVSLCSECEIEDEGEPKQEPRLSGSATENADPDLRRQRRSGARLRASKGQQSIGVAKLNADVSSFLTEAQYSFSSDGTFRRGSGAQNASSRALLLVTR